MQPISREEALIIAEDILIKAEAERLKSAEEDYIRNRSYEDECLSELKVMANEFGEQELKNIKMGFETQHWNKLVKLIDIVEKIKGF